MERCGNRMMRCVSRSLFEEGLGGFLPRVELSLRHKPPTKDECGKVRTVNRSRWVTPSGMAEVCRLPVKTSACAQTANPLSAMAITIPTPTAGLADTARSTSTSRGRNPSVPGNPTVPSPAIRKQTASAGTRS